MNRRLLAIAMAIALSLALAPLAARASEPPRPLRREVCFAEQRPAVTSLAIPPPLRASARRADRIELTRHLHRSRRTTGPWLLLAIAAATAASAFGLFAALE